MVSFAGRIPSLPSLPSLDRGFGRVTSAEPPKITEDGQESNELFIYMLDSQLPYGYEFYGSDVALALTPITERCFLTLTQVTCVLLVAVV